MVYKIAFVYDEFPDSYHSYLESFVEYFKRNNLINLTVYAFRVNNMKAIQIKSNIYQKLNNHFVNKYYNQNYPIGIKNLVKHNYDIIHIQNSYLKHKFLIPFSDETIKTKFVITLRGGDTFIKPLFSADWQDFYKLNLKNVYFIVMCNQQRHSLSNYGVPIEKIFVVPISHNISQTQNYKLKLTNNNVIRIVSSFRLTWEKNIQGNLLFIKALIERGINVEYEVFGDGADLGELYYLVNKLGLGDFVKIHGMVSHDVLIPLLHGFHFILQLSISEGIPGSIIEAQALGIPAIVSDSDGLPESVWVGKSAICRPYSMINEIVDDVIKLWDNQQEYENFCINSIESAKRYNLESEAKSLLEAYKNIIEYNVSSKI
jgi:glycosyltransferase involved in cell wall biosynthesis